ncbi:hypothetical protein LCGC14_2609440, partial [marine sediment metagenome]
YTEDSAKGQGNPVTPSPEHVTQALSEEPEAEGTPSSPLRSEEEGAEPPFEGPQERESVESLRERLRNSPNGQGSIHILSEWAKGQYPEDRVPRDLHQNVGQLVRQVGEKTLVQVMHDAAEYPRDDYLEYVRGVLRDPKAATEGKKVDAKEWIRRYGLPQVKDPDGGGDEPTDDQVGGQEDPEEPPV